jgi:HD domain
MEPVPAGLARLALHLVRLTLESHARNLARRAGIGKPEPLLLEDLAVPDTRLARAATEWGEEVCPPLLLDHGRRGFLFADAIARHRGWKPDREVLYLGCLLHDLGLAPRFDRGGEFERDGADAAVDFLSKRGLSGARLRLLREVIELHDAVHQAHRATLETRLGHFGIGLDVIGYRREDVHPKTLQAIVRAWPRGAFRNEFPATLLDQARRKPGSHIARMVRLGLRARIEQAPLPDRPPGS